MMLHHNRHRDCSEWAGKPVQLITNAEYHGGVGLSSTFLAAIAAGCVSDGIVRRDGGSLTGADVMVGTAAHSLVLEDRWPDTFRIFPETYETTLRSGEVKSRPFPVSGARRDAWAEDALANGAEAVLSVEDAQVATRTACAVAEHVEARALLERCPYREISFYWRDDETGLLLRVRPDAVCDGLVDLKTTSTDIGPDAWSKTIVARGYHVSAALYRDVVRSVLGADPGPMTHIVASTKAPHHVRVYEIGEDTEELGRRAYRRALGMYADWLDDAAENGWAWAGPSREIETIEAPAWALRRGA